MYRSASSPNIRSLVALTSVGDQQLLDGAVLVGGVGALWLGPKQGPGQAEAVLGTSLGHMAREVVGRHLRHLTQPALEAQHPACRTSTLRLRRSEEQMKTVIYNFKKKIF